MIEDDRENHSKREGRSLLCWTSVMTALEIRVFMELTKPSPTSQDLDELSSVSSATRC
jgi:hypothetical protein